MATKKNVPAKGVVRKEASSGKVTPAKKAASPATSKKVSKPVVSGPSKPAAGKEAQKSSPVKSSPNKTAAASVSKQIDKQESKTAVKTDSALKTKKTEPVKNTMKKPESKSTDIPANQESAPAPKPAPAKKETAASKAGKVAMPEIKTKTARKYEPDFTKSVLDTPANDPSSPSQRYSDMDLTEFRDLINKKLDAAKKELNYLQGLITRKDEMGGDESDNRYMTMEDGSISMEREQLSQMASRQITFIDHLEKALMRIENKTYGICRVTGKLIDKARLRAVPHATLSIEAKQTMNR
jgi:RNA polymerase-binding transcription factor DksA